MSITGKHDSLLNSGLLGKLGTPDRGDSLKLNNSAKSLVKMAAYLISEAQKNLKKDGTNSTGDLESSLHIENIDINGRVLSCDVMILDRYKFINDGVRGVESGKGKYAFKHKFPGRKMKDAIKKWIGKGKLKTASIRKPLGGKTEQKNIRFKKVDNTDSLAYAVATNIKKHGIKPTYFFTKAVKATEKKWKDEIATGFKIDIINSLK